MRYAVVVHYPWWNGRAQVYGTFRSRRRAEACLRYLRDFHRKDKDIEIEGRVDVVQRVPRNHWRKYLTPKRDITVTFSPHP